MARTLSSERPSRTGGSMDGLGCDGPESGMKWRVVVDLTGMDGAVQLHEVGSGGDAPMVETIRERTLHVGARLEREAVGALRWATRRTDIGGDRREFGVKTPAPSDGRAATDVLVADASASYARGPNLGRERHVRSGPCRRGALVPVSVSSSGVSTPRFWTVSSPSTSEKIAEASSSNSPLDKRKEAM